ncbi:epoxyqueuosine reductase QueH [Hydrogenimonas urashimensis]|uniref:epoxyqueuosine reductase QueH n=1 Tax=Hydrogenimonas urashimensis TaxID=2740515 RepID=UPI001916B947|nr:epoxyqueuosine reductase QueH [Hydrogenimonas urashimensis]
MLVHICCSVDSHFFLQKLREDFPEERLVGFFYDPNIHPYSEYRLRLLDVQRSCARLGIELIEGPYDYEAWLNAVRGHENDPEKGARCEICFDRRFEMSARKAREIGEKRMTTTLLVSPKKSQEQLVRTGERFARSHGVEFVYVDYRSGGGTQLQQQVSKKERLYRQDYCGCMFGLTIQRNQQHKLADELFSPVDGSVLPGSIEERLAMYEERLKIEEEGKEYRIVRQKFLNYRLKYGWVKRKKETIPSYILPYSVMKRRYTSGKIETKLDSLYCFNREEIRFVRLQDFNRLAERFWHSVAELVYDPPSFTEALHIREKLGLGLWDLSPMIVLEEIPAGKLEILIESEQYQDVREILVTI